MKHTRRTGGGVRAVCRTGAAADHGRDTGIQCRVHLRRGNEMDMAVNAACGQNQPLACNGLGRCAYDHARCDPIHNVRIAGLADAGDFAVLNADIRLVNACTVHDERIRDDRIQTFLVRVRA